jgi:hypothetical protein
MVIDLTDSTARGRILYSRTVKIFKNIDNTVELRFVNHDQKPTSIYGYVPKFHMVDQENQEVVLTKNATVLDDGSTSSNRGLAQVILPASDLANLEAGFYSFCVKLVSAEDVTEETIVYVDDNFDASGELQLLRGAYPDMDVVATDSIDEYDFGQI